MGQDLFHGSLTLCIIDLLRADQPEGEATRVIDEQVASQVMNAMESVSDHYSQFIKVDGYRVAAKSDVRDTTNFRFHPGTSNDTSCTPISDHCGGNQHVLAIS